ncbi:unnamed protein product [Aphanomyces euteiches]
MGERPPNTGATVQMDLRLEKDLRLHLLEEEALTRININQKASRPLNTKIQYSGKQMEYFAWNAELGYTDEHVSDAKTILFLSQMKNRQPRRRGRKKTKLSCDSEVHVYGSAIIDEDQNARSVEYHALAAYINALMDLWRMQYQLGQNPRHPKRDRAIVPFTFEGQILRRQKMFRSAFDLKD